MTLRFKLDENADPRWREPLVQLGYTVSTVVEESLQGAEDEVLAEVCQETVKISPMVGEYQMFHMGQKWV